MATLKDIAARVGVNVTTVSKALRGSNDIKKETQIRIAELAQEMGYMPKRRTAPTPTAGPIKRVGVVTNGGEVFFHQIQKNLERAGYEMLMMIRPVDGYDQIEPMIEHLSSDTVGIIYQDGLGRSMGSFYPDIPVVMIGPNIQSDRYDVVMVDEQAGYRQAVNHLVELGHRKIGFIGDMYCKTRLDYLRAEMNRCGLVLPEKYIVVSKMERHAKCGYEMAQQFIDMEEPPTAIVAQYDDVMLGAIRRFREVGLIAPRDFSIIGFDASRYCAFSTPKMASIDDMYREQADIAVAILKKKINDAGYGAVQSVSVKANYIPRESVGVPRASEKFIFDR